MVAVTAAIAGTGCGDEPGPGAGTITQEIVAPPDSRAVELRGELASLLEQHMFLAAEAVRTGARLGFDSEMYAAAREELRSTRERIVEVLRPLFEDSSRLERFRRHLAELDELVLGYGHEQIEPAFADTPFRTEIEHTREALTALLAEASPELSAQDLADHLGLALENLLLAMDRIGLNAEGELAHTASAAHRARGLAAVLAAAVAREQPEIPEETTAESARLYADLRTLLEEDVLLIFAAVQVGLTRGFESPVWVAASEQVDESALLFADRLATIPEVGGSFVEISAVREPGDTTEPEQGTRGDRLPLERAVRDLLRRHWQLLQLYARESDGDVQNVTKEELSERLHHVITILAKVLARETAVTQSALLDPLERMDRALQKAVEALANRDPAAYDRLAEAVRYAGNAADVLNDGVIRVQVER